MIPAILTSFIPDIISKVVDIADRKFTTEEEKQAAIRETQLVAAKQLQSAWDEEQRQLTERHKNDMASDSWLSKNIRPLSLIYLTGLFTAAFFMEVPEQTFELLRDLLMTVFVFYFGARGLEKIASIVTTGKRGN